MGSPSHRRLYLESSSCEFGALPVTYYEFSAAPPHFRARLTMEQRKALKYDRDAFTRTVSKLAMPPHSSDGFEQPGRDPEKRDLPEPERGPRRDFVGVNRQVGGRNHLYTIPSVLRIELSLVAPRLADLSPGLVFTISRPGRNPRRCAAHSLIASQGVLRCRAREVASAARRRLWDAACTAQNRISFPGAR
jgi:hypothetical protein